MRDLRLKKKVGVQGEPAVVQQSPLYFLHRYTNRATLAWRPLREGRPKRRATKKAVRCTRYGLLCAHCVKHIQH